MRIRAALLLVLAACPKAQPRDATLRDVDLQAICQSSSECSHESNGCVYCYQGHCSCVLPAEPTSDAGVDANGGTSP